MPKKQSWREVEIKFRVADGGQIDDLRSLERRLAGKRLTPVEQKIVLDLYWDTPDFALMRGGFGLRTRRAGEAWLVTLKEMMLNGDSILADRIEVERPLTQAEIDAFLAKPKLERLLAVLRQEGELPEAWSQVRLHKRNPRLHPLALLRQARDKRFLLPSKDDGTPAIAELSLDTVDVMPPSIEHFSSNGNNSTPHFLTQFHEVEVEALGEVAEADLEKVYRSLSRKKSFQQSTSGKLTSALRMAVELSADGTAALHPKAMMAEAGRQIWRQQLLEVLLNERPIRTKTGDRVEAVHDMRVAIRRIRAAARIFGPYFERKEIRPYLNTLRTLASELGTARDLDVSLTLVNQYRKSLGDESGALAAVKAAWKDERRRAYQALEQRLGGQEHSRFIGQFANFCNTPGMGVPDSNGASEQTLAAQEVRHVLPGEILVHYANMRVYESVLHNDTQPEIFHDLRIEGKRLRYALEFVQHLLDPKPAAALVANLKTVQECLGNMNDAMVMQDRLREFNTKQPQAPSVVPVINYLDEQFQQERARFGELWADFVSPSTRRMLAIAVAAL
ncbi:CHAD domain-containing protein [bacterium]|nr:CHAD domain-containing protein [bacterium]